MLPPPRTGEGWGGGLAEGNLLPSPKRTFVLPLPERERAGEGADLGGEDLTEGCLTAKTKVRSGEEVPSG